MDIHLLAKKGSKSAKIIIEHSKVKRLLLKTKPIMLINYGFAGKRKDQILKRKALKNVPVINFICGYNKERAIQLVKNEGVKVPETKSSLDKKDKVNDWLIKMHHSIGGRGIKKAKTKIAPAKHYFQKFIDNRKYELRVHAFSWIPPEEWAIQKRVGDKDTIAWNFHNGGRFITVNNKSATIFKETIDVTKKVLSTLKMEFGAVDFIVDKDLNVYFIEINSQPGLNGLSDSIYVNAFDKLTNMKYKDIIETFNHV